MEHTNILICDNNPLQYPTALDLLRDDLKIMTAVQKKMMVDQNHRITSPGLALHNQPQPIRFIE